MTRAGVRAVGVLLALLAAGCGYRAGYVTRTDVSTVAVPTFGNDTFYRQLEVELTREVISAIEKRTPYRLADARGADVVLEGKIAQYSTLVLQEDTDNRPTETEVVLLTKVTLRRARDGRVLYAGDIREGENFSTLLGETEEQTRAFLFRRAAARIVEAALEQDW